MNIPAIYSDLAPYYDTLLGKQPHEITGDVDDINHIFDEHAPENGIESVLDVGCGTGVHAELLQDSYDVTGVDIAQEMLHVGENTHDLDDVRLVQASMTDLPFTNEFDAIINLFDIVPTVAATVEELVHVFTEFYTVLADDGVVIVETMPVTYQDIEPGDTYVQMGKSTTGETTPPYVVVVQRGETYESKQVITNEYTEVDREKETHQYTDEITYNYFSDDEFVDAFETAGFSVERFDPSMLESGAFIATK